MESEQEHRKSSVETEMENYLKSELGAEVGSVVPDLVKSTSQDSTEESLHTASENLVTSAIISVDDMDSGDYNEVADDEKKAAPAPAEVPESVTGSPPSRGFNNSNISLPKIQISPERASPPQSEEVPQVQTLQPEEKVGELRLCPSPSRIPSRKNSAAATQAINDDLRKLETRLEKFVTKSSEGSECSESSETCQVRSTATVSSRLYSSATASSRAKTADKGQSSSSGNSSPQEKTSTMLKNTLRKMTRFSMTSNVKRKDSSEQQDPGSSSDVSESKSRSRNPFTGKSRVPKSQSPASSGVARSKSFKEPGPPVSRTVGQYNGNIARNNVYTSSLRRTKNKQQREEEREERDGSARAPTAPLGRSGTGGLERGAMRRSVSASRGHNPSVMTSSYTSHGQTSSKLVKKSRPTQTSLTKDACHESPDTDNPGLVNFQVWLPELLGDDGCDAVETSVTDHSEPVDVRKTRALTLENMKLQREVERLRGYQGDNDLLRKEAKTLKSKLEEEQRCRVKIQADLTQYQERVKTCMESMDSVEREFESRDIALQEMTGQQARLEDWGLQVKARLSKAEQVISGQKRELEKSLAAQKTLIHQLQEGETEAREMQEFLQAEKSTLQEALRESEVEIGRLSETVETQRQEAERESKLGEQRQAELSSVRGELVMVKERTREMLVGQGAELSRASVAIISLTSRLEQLLAGQESEEPSENTDSDPVTNIEIPGQARTMARRSSQFLITPTENLEKADLLSEFSRAMMSTSTGSDTMRALMTASTGSEGLEGAPVNSHLPGLTEQINYIESLVTRLVTRNEEMVRSQQENIINGNTPPAVQEDERVGQLETQLGEKERVVQEMMAKFSRNRQILTSNWEQAETEVRRLDEIYHTTVNTVVLALAGLPEVTKQHPSLAQLLNNLQLEKECNNGAEDGERNENNLNGHSNKKVMSRSLVNNSNNSSSEADITRYMSQSQILTNSNTSDIISSLTQSIMSDPGLMKTSSSPHSSIPALASPLSPLSREDMNANQSL